MKRKYEAVRRQWLEEEKDDQHEIASQRMKKKKYASRLQEGLRYCVCVTFNVNFSQKFDRRSVVVLEAERIMQLVLEAAISRVYER